MEGNFPGIFPTGVENWFEFAKVSNNRGFEKSGIKLNYSVTVKQILSKFKGNDDWFELSGGSRNRGFEKSGFFCSSKLLNVSSTLNLSDNCWHSVYCTYEFVDE